MRKKYIFLILISVIWGSQFYFAEKVLDKVDPVALAAIRSTLGAITLTVVAILNKNPTHKSEEQRSHLTYVLYVSIALLEAVIPFFLVAWGQQRVNSSIASILIGTTPIWTLLMVRVVFRKKLNLYQTTGVISGFIGIVFIFLPSIGANLFSNGIAGSIALLIASISYASALVFMQYLPSETTVVSMRNILCIASVILIPVTFIIENPTLTTLNIADIINLLILGIFQTGFVYWLYNLLIHMEGAVFASFSNYFIPVIGVLLGSLFLNESVSILMLIGLFIIIFSIIISRKTKT
ncbi:DMT family transporter [Sediminibacillus albus]|uniref:Permease of the drug/metabolite transporter (DMT) superfamily n=1 Tax=Sediminibacillus albus TaxID=407036 RepID=A0A1G9B9X9_9BACI|nr:DMT family transporter [Sediminibacillus albus]SDK36321.1 Permease of the drug/metabolite transporter (DMT) superfamily [Sediminibacillus albus]